MTIASAFNDIAVAQGGTAAKSGAITAAIDALNDALAGSDQPQAKTIEEAVRLLGEHIGGGGGGTVKCYILNDDDWDTPFNIGDLSVVDGNGASVTASADQITLESPMGADTYDCLSFSANAASVYKIARDKNIILAGGNLNLIPIGQDSLLPSMFDNAVFSFIAPSADVIAALTVQA